ncbi:hypothetical protein AAFF_G00014710 [Aldrovandia affinis]|uniref:Uncharacterized protein n=1 Tax=Aldrovandia affinis TaxID=143900 RepID=A0AAD7R2X1_9TELE|nr:hypothetical protein AAFF_G00014710 [Aldrovandia affinis]
MFAHAENVPQISKVKIMNPLRPSRLQAPAPRAVPAPYVFPVSAQAPAPAPDQGPAPVQVPTTAPDLDLVALAGQSVRSCLGEGGAFPPQVFAPDLPQVGHVRRADSVEWRQLRRGCHMGCTPRQIESEDPGGVRGGVPVQPLEAVGSPQEWGTLWSLRELERPAG